MGTPLLTKSGSERQVGVEIEYAGLESKTVVNCIQQLFGGSLQANTRYEMKVVDTKFGDFKIELDASTLKSLASNLDLQHADEGDNSLETLASNLLTKAAEQVIPWELVCPPVEFSQMNDLCDLITSLRQHGALGTRHSVRYGFGVHFNQELPDTSATCILNYLRAFLCMYDWFVEMDQIDLTRKLMPFINHFGKDYTRLVVDWNYQPDQDQLIDDYLKYNPTRNRSLDMLPLFTFLDENKVRSKLKEEKINKRPTLHFRMPNSDIDNPEWNLDSPWNLWLVIERLATNEVDLKERCEAYLDFLNNPFSSFDSDWLKQSTEWANEKNL